MIVMRILTWTLLAAGAVMLGLNIVGLLIAPSISLALTAIGLTVSGGFCAYMFAQANFGRDIQHTPWHSVYAYPEVNPNVDLDQLLKTFPKLSVSGTVCRDCGMDDQELDRGLRCPVCQALWIANGEDA